MSGENNSASKIIRNRNVNIAVLLRTFPFAFLRLLLGWLCFFAITRLIFIVYNTDELTGVPFFEIIQSFFEALYVDISMACYFTAIPFLGYVAFSITGKQFFLSFNKWFSRLLLFIVSAITITELPLYDEWSHKLTYKALWFLKQPEEVFNTASVFQLIGGLIGIVLLTAAGWLLFNKIVPKAILPKRVRWLTAIIFFLIGTPLVAIGIRGGLQPIPVQVSDAYFSHHNFLNEAAANSTFHLLSNVMQNLEAYKPYTFYSRETVDSIITELHSVEKDTTISFLKTDRPNIVLVVFEGWSADVIESLGGYKGIAPHFSELVRNGISFDSCYASGNLSDQGIGAVFSAFPAQPKTSIVTIPGKYGKLPCINYEFRKAGYHTSFMFGGQLNYGNIRSYMYHNNFDRIIEGDDFPTDIFQGRLGVHDAELYTREIEELKKTQQPFFASMFTLSTHAPYDFKMKEVLHWGNESKDYINAVYYADSVLNNFMNQAKTQSWYSNTLFVFVSDHHHNTPKNYSYYSPQYRRIPLVFYGDVIKPEFRGYLSNQICSQLDLASTLMHQLKMNSAPFYWSKNLFNPYSKQFAFFTFDEGFGWKRPEGQFVWYVKENRFESEQYSSPEAKAKLFREGKAYLQRVSEDFWNR